MEVLSSPAASTSRRALGSLSGNDVAARQPPDASLTTPKLSKGKAKSQARPPVESPPRAEDEQVEAFGVRGVLQAARGPAPPTLEVFGVEGVLEDQRGPPPPSPQIQWPSEWPKEWDAEAVAFTEEFDAAWAEKEEETGPETPTMATPMKAKTPMKVKTPSSAAVAIAISVACSGGGGKAVKKSKAAPPKTPQSRNTEAMDDDSPALMRTEEMKLARATANLSTKGLAAVGARARAARAAARGTAAAEARLDGLMEGLASPSGAGPVPVRPAMSRAAMAADAADAAYERRAEQLRAEMFAAEPPAREPPLFIAPAATGKKAAEASSQPPKLEAPRVMCVAARAAQEAIELE